MQLVIIIGPHAAGKMTVGQELEKITDLRLFHNHLTIELVSHFFSYSTPRGQELVQKIRAEFFNAFSESDEAGYIFTFVWAFNEEGQREYIEGISKVFEEKGAEVFWVELEVPIEERLRRNRTDNRLQHKPSKRDLEFSERNLIEGNRKYRLNSYSGEISRLNYVRIDNTTLSAEAVAKQISAYLT
jgi:hypothetical protein